MVIGLLSFALAQAASVLGARALLRRVRTGDRAVDLLQLLLLRLLLVTGTVLTAGLVGALDPVSLGLAASAALVVLVAAGAHRGLGRFDLPDAGPWILAAAAFVAVRLALQVWYFAPHLGDAVAYHLPKVAEWVRHGAFTREMGLHPHVTFPAGFELVETWWVVFLRHDVLLEAAGVEFVVLAASAVYVLARRTGLGERAASLASLVFVLTPGFHLSATSGLNDAPAAALTLATAGLVAARAPWASVVVAAALGLGVKPTAGFALPGLVLLAWMLRSDRRPASGPAWTLAGAAAAVGVFWYARNAAWFGNPFHPLGTPGIDNPVAVQLGPRPASLFANLRDLLSSRLLDPAAAAGANVDHGAGWGPAAVAVGSVGLLIGLRDRPFLRPLAASFAVSLLTTLLFVQNDPWCLKYAFFFPALLAVAAAGWAEQARPAGVLTALALAVCAAGTMLPYDLPTADFLRLAEQPVSTRSALGFWADPVPDDAVGCRGGYDVRSYLLYRPDFSRTVVYLRGAEAEGPAHLYGTPPPSAPYAPAGRRLYRRRP